MPNFEASGDLMSPLSLFLHADIVVKIVMLGLLAASVWTWAIIFTHAIRLKRINRATGKFEDAFWASDDIDAFYQQARRRKASQRCDPLRRPRRMAPLDPGQDDRPLGHPRAARHAG